MRRKFADLSERVDFEVGEKFIALKVGEPGPSRCSEETDGEPLFHATMTKEIHTGKAQLHGAEARVRVVPGERRCGSAAAPDADVERRRWRLFLHFHQAPPPP